MRPALCWAAGAAIDLAARAAANVLVAIVLATIGAVVLLREVGL